MIRTHHSTGPVGMDPLSVYCIVVMNSLSSPNIVQPEEIMMHAQNSRIPVDTKLSIVQ